MKYITGLMAWNTSGKAVTIDAILMKVHQFVGSENTLVKNIT